MYSAGKVFICVIAFFGMVDGVSFTNRNYTITSIPPQLGDPPTIHILRITDCKDLKQLVNDSFITYPNLEKLYLDGNSIRIIEEGTLNGLFVLDTITFTNNGLIQIPRVPFPQPSMERLLALGFGQAFVSPPKFKYPYFAGFPNLQYLDLTGLHPIYFTARILPPSLLKLFMSVAGLTEMPDFSRCTPNLIWLTLGGNPIGDFPIERIAGLDKLTWVRMTRFPLTSLDVSTLVSMEKLDMYDNQLTTLSGLSNLTKLMILNVYRNDLTSLPDSFHLPNLGAMNMANNPWVCGQDICWLWALLFRKPMVIHAPLICTSPSHLAGRNFLSMREEDLGCQLSNFG